MSSTEGANEASNPAPLPQLNLDTSKDTFNGQSANNDQISNSTALPLDHTPPSPSGSTEPPAKKSRKAMKREQRNLQSRNPPTTFATLNTFGWTMRPEFNFDDNISELALIAARQSTSWRGYMGCVIVRSPESTEPDAGKVLVISTNVAFYPKMGSGKKKEGPEIHAEANAVCSSARLGISTKDAWLYVTFPPCRDCFMLIVYAGIKRVVFRQKMLDESIKDVANRWGVELVERRDIAWDDECNKRIAGMMAKWKEENPGELPVEESREEGEEEDVEIGQDEEDGQEH